MLIYVSQIILIHQFYKQYFSIMRPAKNQQQQHAPAIASKSPKTLTNNHSWIQSSFFSIFNFCKTQQPKHLYIMGQQCQCVEEAIQKLSKVIQFTYRDKNYKLRELSIQRQISSDTGWGCVLRVGQMTLANTLKRYFQSLKINDQKNISKILHGTFLLILAFLDFQDCQQKYSLNKILEVCNNKYKKRPDQWFSFPQISFALQQLHNKQSMKGAERLKILTFNHSIIFLKYVFEILKIPNCKCLKRKTICKDCHQLYLLKITHQIDVSKLEMQKKSGLSVDIIETQKRQNLNSVLILLPCILGYNNLEDRFFQGMLQILEQPFNAGIMARNHQKALYFVGKQGKQIIYSDPHQLAQFPTKQTFERLFNTFFCSQYRRIDQMSIDPSLCFAFYLDSFESLLQFVSFIDKMKQQKLINFSYMWSIPQNSGIVVSGLQEQEIGKSQKF